MNKTLLIAGAIIGILYLNRKNKQTQNALYDGDFDENFFRNFDNATSNKMNYYQT